ncbi:MULTISPECIES: AAA family ATPase [unclassified Acinetobacter]|uniref:AAA family ATPase n=1 Tax=unclassified Acinetobacter TaxID=196816 RepID=UPI0035B9DA0A
MLNISQALAQNQTPHIKRILFLGAECTGKTTLCQDLARHWQTTWVAEYMREYLQEKWDVLHQSCEWHDIIPIAIGQVQSENQQAERAKQYLFCDTGLIELMVYSQLYYKSCPKEIVDQALLHHYDLIIIPEVDNIVWQADDLRDCPNGREDIVTLFKHCLDEHGKTYHCVIGDRMQRVAQVNQLLASLA